VVCPLLVAGLKSFLHGRADALRWVVCGLVVALFVWSIAFFYLPGVGFTYMIEFGALEHERYIPELKAINHYEMPNSPGYDSQWYAQIAMHPHLRDPVLRKAVDSLPYRARRILFVMTAAVLGGGDPVRVMNIYALQNVFCWFILAAILLRWFPPVSWGNCFRWACTLFSFGLIFSVRGALLDGPSLLLATIGMALVESGRLWLGAAVMGVSGLGKDTSILCGAALPLPQAGNPRTWARCLARGVILLLPLAVWMVCVRMIVGRGDDIGARNFAGPFVGLAHKLQHTLSSISRERYPYPSVAKFDLLVLAGLLAQFLFFAFRMRWSNPWWRLGASYAVLMIFLGDAVWENYPSAAARVLLPMTLAFNILVPRRRLWPILLVVGNLGVFASADLLKPPGRESFEVEGPRSLRINPKDGSVVEAVFGPENWGWQEKSRWDYWRWSMGDSWVAIRNPQPFPIMADIKFRLRAVDLRGATVTLNGRVVWSGLLQPAEVRKAKLAGVELPPGDTVLYFKSDRPSANPGNDDPRSLTFSVRDLEIDLRSRR
jgi:hypothetical protein